MGRRKASWKFGARRHETGRAKKPLPLLTPTWSSVWYIGWNRDLVYPLCYAYSLIPLHMSLFPGACFVLLIPR